MMRPPGAYRVTDRSALAPSSSPSVASNTPLLERSPGLLLRLAAMTYEAVLLFGVVFIASFPLLAATGWTYPLPPRQRWALQAVLFVAVGIYFVTCWVRSGQTLAMKSWQLRLVDRDGRLLTPPRAVLRYLLAWSLFVPGLAFAALAGAGIAANLLALLAGLLLMVALARLDRGGQLLHDRLLGSRVVRS
jgi:uncharacterized RDD family membrane protein YckC